MGAGERGEGILRRRVPPSDTIKALQQKRCGGEEVEEKVKCPGTAWCVRGFSFRVERARQLRAINIHEDEPAP